MPARLSHKRQNHGPAPVGTAENLAQLAFLQVYPDGRLGEEKGTSEEKLDLW